jgi:hypothetical protein
MRKLLFVLLPAFACAVAFISCQKEIDPSILTAPPNDSIYVSRIIELDTTLPSGSDTVWINYYYYDSQKRLWRIKESEYDQTGEIWSDTLEYRYQGTQNLPVNYRYLDGNNPDSSVSYLKYSNGFIILDSMIAYSSGVAMNAQITRIRSLGGNRYEKTIIVESPASSGNTLTVDSTIFIRTLSNGNVITGVDSAFGNGGPLVQRRDFQIGYDNKHGLFKDFQFWYLGYYGDVYDLNVANGNNNATSQSETLENIGGITVSYSYTFSYIYRSDGYPLEVRINGSSGIFSNKAIIKYTSL